MSGPFLSRIYRPAHSLRDTDLWIAIHLLMQTVDETKDLNENVTFIEEWKAGFEWFPPGVIDLELSQSFNGSNSKKNQFTHPLMREPEHAAARKIG